MLSLILPSWLKFTLRLLLSLGFSLVICVLEYVLFWLAGIPASLAKDLGTIFFIAGPLLGLAGIIFYTLKGGWAIALFIIPIMGAYLSIWLAKHYLNIPPIIGF